MDDIMVDIFGICSFYNTNLPHTTLDITLFLEIEASVCYRLLRFHPLGSPWSDAGGLDAAYHIGVTGLMMSMLLRFDKRRALDYSLVTRCLWHVLDGPSLDESKHELKLWVMMMGGLWISGEDNVDLLASRIRATSQRLGLETWPAVLGRVAKFPWIHALHDEPGRELWEKACQLSQTYIPHVHTVSGTHALLEETPV
jgi:hypothetical protein